MARPIAIDLFCGAGGMSLGFEQAGFDIVLGVDRDAYHCSAHERNFPYGKTLCASVTDISGQQIRDLCGISQDIDVVFGGPPCQGFSVMGKRDVDDPRSSLVGEFVRLIKEIHPKAFVMENVPGMQLGKTRDYFEFVVKSLSDIGYNIQLPAQTLVASNFGAPQKRERLFIIGVRTDIGRFPKYPDGPLRGQAFAKTIADAFGGLPNVDINDDLFVSDSIEKQKAEGDLPQYSAIMSGTKKDSTDLSYPRRLAEKMIFGNKRTKHSSSSISLYNSTLPGQMVPGHKLPRLSLGGISPTLRAGSESERGSHTAPRPIHPTVPRCITVREAARLHGFPDWFAFYPVIHHGFRQVGNSVSPLVARAVGYSIAEALSIGRDERKPNRSIQLQNSFPLIEGRKKHEKRISHLDEFPKVINYLFLQRFNAKTGVLSNRRFTFQQIAEAIEQSSANMPRVRPDSFISEISRTRNAKQILEGPLSHGYSVVGTPEGGCFVESDQVAAIGKVSYISFNSAEVKDCIQIALPTDPANSVNKSFSIMANSDFCRIIGKIDQDTDLFENNVSDRQAIRVRKDRKVARGAFWKTKMKMIRYEAIRKIGELHNAGIVILSVPLTRHHEGIAAFQVDGDKVIQRYKQVFFVESK